MCSPGRRHCLGGTLWPQGGSLSSAPRPVRLARREHVLCGHLGQCPVPSSQARRRGDASAGEDPWPVWTSGAGGRGGRRPVLPPRGARITSLWSGAGLGVALSRFQESVCLVDPEVALFSPRPSCGSQVSRRRGTSGERVSACLRGAPSTLLAGPASPISCAPAGLVHRAGSRGRSAEGGGSPRGRRERAPG